MEVLQNQWTFQVKIHFVNCLWSHQLSTVSFLLVLGHCFFPLPVEGSDWLCHSTTQASFLWYPVLTFWENAQEMVISVRPLKSLFLMLVFLGIPRFLTQAPVMRIN